MRHPSVCDRSIRRRPWGGRKLGVALAALLISAGAGSAVAKDCTAPAGFKTCKETKHGIQVIGSQNASVSAVENVATILTNMLDRVKAPYSASGTTGFKAYVTFGEAWSSMPSPVSTISNGDELRGISAWTGARSTSWIWVSEQMMCKTGVATRNAAFAAGQRAKGDSDVRAWDQVVHEFGHSLENFFSLKSEVDKVYKGTISSNSREDWAWAVQGWFGNPSRVYDDVLNGDQKALLAKVFTERWSPRPCTWVQVREHCRSNSNVIKEAKSSGCHSVPGGASFLEAGYGTKATFYTGSNCTGAWIELDGRAGNKSKNLCDTSQLMATYNDKVRSVKIE